MKFEVTSAVSYFEILFKALIGKSDEENEENRRSVEGCSTSQPSVLSQLLLNTNNGPSNTNRGQDHTDNYLDRMTNAGMKRKFEDSKGAPGNVKRATPENQQVL